MWERRLSGLRLAVSVGFFGSAEPDKLAKLPVSCGCMDVGDTLEVRDGADALLR